MQRGNTSRQCLPFTGLVGLSCRKTHPQRFEAVLHFTATFALCQFVRDTQLWCPAVRRAAQGVWISNEIPDLLVL